MFDTLFGSIGRGHEIAVVVDVEGGSVEIAIVRLNLHDAPSEILLAHRREIPYTDRPEELAVSGVLSVLSDMGDQVMRDWRDKFRSHYGNPTASHVVVGSPFCQSRTIRSEKRFERATIITNHVIGAYARESLAGEHDIDQAALVEAGVVLVELNGYPTARPHGKEAVVMRLSIIASEIPDKIKKALSSRIQQIFGMAPTMHSRTRAISAALDAFGHSDLSAHVGEYDASWAVSDERRYSVIDIESYASRVITMHNNVPTRVEYVPIGTHTIAYEVGEGGGDTSRLEQSILKSFGERMALFAEGGYLPMHLVVFAPHTFAETYTHLFSRIDLMQFTSTNEPFEVRFFSTPDVAPFVVRAAALGEADVSPRIACAAALVHSERRRKGRDE